MAGVRCDIMMTQSPSSLPVSHGDRVTITCRASQGISNRLDWIQQKPGQAPKLLINGVNTLASGIPPGDAAVYYCCKYNCSSTHLDINFLNSQSLRELFRKKTPEPIQGKFATGYFNNEMPKEFQVS
uniref:Ig-like domain-containing protein n=1 Tax=Urocitellus parryii TaxID=9999 RepID=A0A8D2I3V8_UROPR